MTDNPVSCEPSQLRTMLEILQYEWAIRALIASSMVGVMCGILGAFIVLRNMSLVGDALSHAVLPGVVFGFVVAGYAVMGFFLGAVLAGIIAAILITWLQNNVPIKNDAAIGIVFTAMFSIGVMWISRISRNDGVHLDLNDFLFGNALGVSNQDLYLTGVITIVVIINVVMFYRYLFATTFQSVIAETMGISVQVVYYFLMSLLSLAIVASMKAVGVILVVAMLIAPACTALLLSDRLQIVVMISAFFGLLSAVTGLLFAIWLDTTPGPAMAIMGAFFFLLAVFFSPKKGLLFKYVRQNRLREKVEIEDVLKQSLKLHELGELTFGKLVNRLSFKSAKIKRYLNVLQKKGLVNFSKNKIVLTGKGIDQGTKLVRAHRLWETYLVEKVGLTGEQIHEDAEIYEHILTDELMDEVEHDLGYPTVDPHGSPIPKKNIIQHLKLSQIGQNQRAIILEKQDTEQASAELWKLGLMPNTKILIVNLKDNHMKIKQKEQIIDISLGLAEQICVSLNG